MVICPIAVVAGCEKCPVFKVCPLTKVLGDQGKADEDKKSDKKDSSNGKKKS